MSTSLEAYGSIDAQVLRERVYRFVASCGSHGATCDEVEEALGMLHQTASARMNELKSDAFDMIYPVGRRKTRSGRAAEVYRAREVCIAGPPDLRLLDEALAGLLDNLLLERARD